MLVDRGTESVLQALPEPALVVGTDGRIAFANGAALTRLNIDGDGAGDLTQLADGAAAVAALRAYLLRCSGSRSPLLGAMELQEAGGQFVRFRCHGCLLEPARTDAPARLLLRLSDRGDERFSVLSQQVRDLNDEVRRRRRAQAMLEEALRDRELLVRELHHRVKNNIHMLVGMFSTARREAAAPEVASVLDEATRRLAAVGAVHQMLYLKDNLRTVRGDEFVARIAGMVMEGAGAGERLVVSAEPVDILNDAAVPLALILNELLANALKHGNRADGSLGRVHLNFASANGFIELSIEDEGPGFSPEVVAGRRASGLGLVRGLSRQVGGTFSVGPGRTGGARCVVRFRNHNAAVVTTETGQP